MIKNFFSLRNIALAEISIAVLLDVYQAVFIVIKIPTLANPTDYIGHFLGLFLLWFIMVTTPGFALYVYAKMLKQKKPKPTHIKSITLGGILLLMHIAFYFIAFVLDIVIGFSFIVDAKGFQGM